jgi:leader peptidase (prepilin peptidase)/N-methyltransferase
VFSSRRKRHDILTLLPPWFINGFSVAFGLIIGSFLNVVVYRLPRKMSLVRPRSRCLNCERQLSWYENIPVVSYLIQKGKCRGCQAPISVRYPIIELLTALLFLATEIKFGFSYLLFIHDWPFVALLVAITFIDLEHRIIPDEMSLGGLVLGLLTCWLVPGLGLSSAVIGAGFGFCFFYALAWAYLRFTGRSGLGGGDIKLLAMLGAFIGAGGVFATIFISSIFGSLVGIGWGIAQGRQKVMSVAIPYGPFLVVGALYYYLMGDILWFRFTIPT